MGDKEILQALDARRRQLHMSYAVLAQRSGLSMPTVVRLLSSHDPQTNFRNVLAIAAALGMTLDVKPIVEISEFLERQAEAKAEKLVGLVQGTCALEAQAVDAEAIRRMKQQTIHELLAGSRRRLWSD